ncbi:sporulation integral membrane protein YlbJ [Salipaludibacillus sp. LMS25]|jgi:sporulation integral membrane protein YlbJ|uniref:sporulation integral membrane protein YlbJ n=1 Tax=Salipaludibacillus sp. LMS25 TaxID=2924031 RepID=UPI0020D04AED|nr:sporulation integral membrane protein YlbJ [Salipaludibacillus sp. LMS25]UTR15206.1 sporulation integral membrane protein YlbJ [Salipaludibacillus sp. LMS25]
MARLQFIRTVVYGITASFLAVCFVIFPKEASEASVRGMTVWWDIVFPSLLPFFILSEFLIRFGVVTFIGILLEPFMRPLFRVPGSGGFVWAMGLASGFPSGAKLTVRLWEEGHLTREEGERLVSFSNASNPLFIFGAVAVGFFQDVALGFLLAASHYLGNILVGFTMRFHKLTPSTKSHQTRSTVSLKQAIKNMHYDRLKDQEPLGKILGDAVNSSMQTLLMIGGFMIFFSVLNEILEIIRLTDIFAIVTSFMLSLVNMPNELSPGVIAGLFEITLGSQRISDASQATLMQQAIVTSFILAFNGFSVQAQVASILSHTDIRFLPFFIARCLHGVISAFLAFLLFTPLYVDRFSQPSLSFWQNTSIDKLAWSYEAVIAYFQWLQQYGSLMTALCLIGWLLWYITPEIADLKRE